MHLVNTFDCERCEVESGLATGFSRRVLTDSFFNALLVFCIARRPVAEAVRNRLLFEDKPCVVVALILFTRMEDAAGPLLLLLLGGAKLSSEEAGLLVDGNETMEQLHSGFDGGGCNNSVADGPAVSQQRLRKLIR